MCHVWTAWECTSTIVLGTTLCVNEALDCRSRRWQFHNISSSSRPDQLLGPIFIIFCLVGHSSPSQLSLISVCQCFMSLQRLLLSCHLTHGRRLWKNQLMLSADEKVREQKWEVLSIDYLIYEIKKGKMAFRRRHMKWKRVKKRARF